MSGQSKQVDIEIGQGDKFPIEFTVYERAVTGGQSILDLTASTVTLYLRNVRTGEDKIAGGSCTLDGDPTTGKCTITLSTTQTDTPGKYIGYLRIENLGGAGVAEKRTKKFTVSIGSNFE